MQASLTIPPGANLVSGDNPVYIGDLNAGQSRNVSWTLVFAAAGIFSLDVKASGYRLDSGGYVETHGFAAVTVMDRPPAISILSPQNTTYANSKVPLDFTVNETTDWRGYSLDGQANVTIPGNTTVKSIPDGVHSLVVYANDTGGNMGVSNIVHFTVQDTTPPAIVIMSPQNRTYSIINIPFTFTVDENVSWMAYSLDRQANVTTSGNTTLTGLDEGSHNIIVFARDTAGNTGLSDRAHFSFERRHDVAVINVATSKTGCLPKETVGQGYSVRVHVTVENQGSFAETFNVNAYVNSSAIGELQVTLTSGESKILTFVWNTTDFVNGNYIVSAYAWQVPGETHTSDNTMHANAEVYVTTPGDVDGDSDVDIFDITRMVGAYGLSEVDPAFDPNCDIDDDGDVDIFDIIAAVISYGQS